LVLDRAKHGRHLAVGIFVRFAMPIRGIAALLLGAGLLTSTAIAAPIISDAWIRAMPGNSPAGGYFTLTNPGRGLVRLTGATSTACGSIMLHMTHKTGGLAHMMAVDHVDLPANGRIAFQPGGYHLMCMEPKGLTPGTGVPVTLGFADGSHVAATFAVKNATGK
jgi:copper(I)-binding protein